jgi:hypothetical protein
MFGLSHMVHAAQLAQQQLERLDRQYGTPSTAACLLEGRGWLALAEGNGGETAVTFRQAADQWQVLGHPYDEARALSGLGQALVQGGDRKGAQLAGEQAEVLINALAAQLEDHELKSA